MKNTFTLKGADSKMAMMRQTELTRLFIESWAMVHNRLLSQGFKHRKIKNAFKATRLMFREGSNPNMREIKQMLSEPYKETLLTYIRFELLR